MNVFNSIVKNYIKETLDTHPEKILFLIIIKNNHEYKKKIIVFIIRYNNYKEIFSEISKKQGLKLNTFFYDNRKNSSMIIDLNYKNFNISNQKFLYNISSEIFDKLFGPDFVKSCSFKNATLDYEIYNTPHSLKPYIFRLIIFDISSSLNIIEHINVLSLYKNNNFSFLHNTLEILFLINKKWIIWIHNLNFDIFFIIESFHLYNKIYKNKIINLKCGYHNSKLYFVQISLYNFTNKKNSTLFFYCSFILLEGSLNSFRKKFLWDHKFDFPKSTSLPILKTNKVRCKINFSSPSKIKYYLYSFFSKKSKNLLEISKTYCIFDRLLLSKILKIYIQNLKRIHTSQFNILNSLTSTSVTFNYFLNSHYKHSRNLSQIGRNNNIYLPMHERYVGGRCEVIQIKPMKTHKIFYYDFPGIYSLVIQTKLPIGSIVSTEILSKNLSLKSPHSYIKIIIKDLNKKSIVGHFNVSIKSHKSSFLPIIHLKKTSIILTRKNENFQKLIFLNGIIQVILYTNELEYSIETGSEILKIHSFILYEGGFPFAKYVKEITNNKRAYGKFGNSSLKKIYKNIVNILYGRFALNTHIRKLAFFENWLILHNLESDLSLSSIRISRIKILDPNSFTGISLWGKSVPTISKTNISIASAITSTARIILHKSLISVIAGVNNSKIIYIDTDSIFISSFKNPLKTKLINQHNFKNANIPLNLVWNSKTSYDYGNFLSPKIYYLWKENINLCKITSKGMHCSRLSLIIYTLEQINSLSFYSFSMYTLPVFTKFKSFIPIISFEIAYKLIDPKNKFKRNILFKKGAVSFITSSYNIHTRDFWKNSLQTISFYNQIQLKFLIKNNLTESETFFNYVKAPPNEIVFPFLERKIKVNLKHLPIRGASYFFKIIPSAEISQSKNKNIDTLITLFLICLYIRKIVEIHLTELKIIKFQICTEEIETKRLKVQTLYKTLFSLDPKCYNLYKTGIIPFITKGLENLNREKEDYNLPKLDDTFLIILIFKNHQKNKIINWSLINNTKINPGSIKNLLNIIHSRNSDNCSSWPKYLLKKISLTNILYKDTN